MLQRVSHFFNKKQNTQIRKSLRRNYVSHQKSLVAKYEGFGDPQKVVKLVEEDLPAVGENDVLVKMLYSPINPADINMIQGTYPIKPSSFPAVGGNEGVGKVVSVGKSVKGLKVDDLVMPDLPGAGTWRSHAVLAEKDLYQLPKIPGVQEEYLASMSVNPTSAYRMLNDFVDLKEGDVIIQNGANSMVGTCVNQIAAARGIKVISVIRKSRADYEEIVDHLKDYGAYIVVADCELGTREFKEMISDLPQPKLALNMTGGACATDIARLLGPSGTMVTYGGMSRKPVTVPTSLLIFNDIKLKGFWLSRWSQQASKQQRDKMYADIMEMYRNGTLRLWQERHEFQHFDIALDRALTPSTRTRKVLLKF